MDNNYNIKVLCGSWLLQSYEWMKRGQRDAEFQVSGEKPLDEVIKIAEEKVVSTYDSSEAQYFAHTEKCSQGFVFFNNELVYAVTAEFSERIYNDFNEKISPHIYHYNKEKLDEMFQSHNKQVK